MIYDGDVIPQLLDLGASRGGELDQPLCALQELLLWKRIEVRGSLHAFVGKSGVVEVHVRPWPSHNSKHKRSRLGRCVPLGVWGAAAGA